MIIYRICSVNEKKIELVNTIHIEKELKPIWRGISDPCQRKKVWNGGDAVPRWSIAKLHSAQPIKNWWGGTSAHIPWKVCFRANDN